MNILKNNTYYFMKLITVCELIILLMSRDIKTRYNGNLLNYMMVLAVPLVWITITVISFQYLNRTVPIFTDDIITVSVISLYHYRNHAHPFILYIVGGCLAG